MESTNTIEEDVPFSFPEYIMIEQYDAFTLSDSVNSHIKRGFEVVGAPFTVTRYTFESRWDSGFNKYVDYERKIVSFCQAMIKKTRNPFTRTIKVTTQKPENPF